MLKIGFSIFSSQEIGLSLISFEQIEVEISGVENPKNPGIQSYIQGREHFEHAEFTIVHLICHTFKCCGNIS